MGSQRVELIRVVVVTLPALKDNYDSTIVVTNKIDMLPIQTVGKVGITNEKTD